MNSGANPPSGLINSHLLTLPLFPPAQTAGHYPVEAPSAELVGGEDGLGRELPSRAEDQAPRAPHLAVDLLELGRLGVHREVVEDGEEVGQGLPAAGLRLDKEVGIPLPAEQNTAALNLHAGGFLNSHLSHSFHYLVVQS